MVTPTTHGNNIPCSIPDSAVEILLGESVLGSGLKESAVLVVNISNTGMQPTPNSDSDLYKFDVYVMMMPDATEGETFSLTVDVNDIGPQTVDFTTGPPANYTEDADYTFTLESDCVYNVHHAGSTLAFKMKVQTERSVTVGPMSIEVPIPTNVTQSHLKYKSGKVISKGKNVVCLAYGNLSAELTDW
ncbi:uncharacterized protein LOC128551635 [Mercenaria mercenaria]|uniref:uncharacterized protein LOC128551635 n=1 Tax=Mercenaria mercenaria TaxID=6596 RepID=UPI00234F304C|nr:uncharacterized protein LOC128551635 [Mercenaria mercenaria]